MLKRVLFEITSSNSTASSSLVFTGSTLPQTNGQDKSFEASTDSTRICIEEKSCRFLLPLPAAMRNLRPQHGPTVRVLRGTRRMALGGLVLQMGQLFRKCPRSLHRQQSINSVAQGQQIPTQRQMPQSKSEQRHSESRSILLEKCKRCRAAGAQDRSLLASSSLSSRLLRAASTSA